MTKFYEWLYRSGLTPMVVGESCCAQELSALQSDQEQSGTKLIIGENKNCGPAFADVLIVTGCVTIKYGQILKEFYDKMSAPRWVVAIGACASSGGLFRTDSVLQGVSTIIPVDVYIPGCPPTRESMAQGFEELKKIVKSSGVHP